MISGLSDKGKRLYDLWGELFNTAYITEHGDTWTLHTTEEVTEYDDRDELMEMMMENVKEALLIYALNGELQDVVDMMEV